MLTVRAQYRFLDRMFLHDCITEYVKCSGLVVDLGAGKNEFYQDLLTGYDRYLTFDLVKDNAPNIAGSIESLPFKENTIDTILAFNVLEHIYEYKNAVRGMYHTLKRGGTLYGIVPFMVNIHDDPYDYHRYTPRALSRCLSDEHFKNIEIIELSGSLLLIAQLLSFYPFLWRFTNPLYRVCNALNNYIMRLGKHNQLARFDRNVVLSIFFKAQK